MTQRKTISKKKMVMKMVEGGKSSYEATAAGKYAAHKPCLIAANLNFTSLKQSRGDSLQVMTSRAASCVVTPYIPDIFGPLRTEQIGRAHV